MPLHTAPVGAAYAHLHLGTVVVATAREKHPLAPSYALVMAYKNRQIDWPTYTARYRAEMAAKWKTDRAPFLEVIRAAAAGDVTLVCYCHWATEANPVCHRFLLRDLLLALTAKLRAAGQLPGESSTGPPSPVPAADPTAPITRFAGAHAFLSNFAPAVVRLDDRAYPSVEHAYHAAKTTDPTRRIPFTTQPRTPLTATQAKRLGRELPLRPDWARVRDGVMLGLLRRKFDDEPFLGQLLATGDVPLVEGNTWHDTYWGRCACPTHQGKGQNTLGRMLMRVRHDLRQGPR